MSLNQPFGNQLQAVDSAANHLMVIGPPGCGKTEVLAMRADHLFRAGKVRPQRRLLATTFTNRAKENLGRRLRQQLGEERFRTSVSVMNFHELGARVVEAHWKSIGLTAGFIFPKAAWMHGAMNEFDRNYQKQKEAMDILSAIKRNPISDEEVLRLVRLSGNLLAFQVEERRQIENYLDYADVLRHAQRLLTMEPIAALFQEHFDALLVDEFQDLSIQQFEITSLICTKNATYVGDPLQGIFGYAGADPLTVRGRLEGFVQEIINLDVSFRSSPAVLNVVNVISATLGAGQLRAADPTNWAGGGQAFAATFASDVDEARGIVNLTDYLSNKYPQDRIGVIFRASYRRAEMESAYTSARHQPQYWDVALETPRVTRLLKQHARRIPSEPPFREQLEELARRVNRALRRSDIDTMAEVESAYEQLLELAQPNESLVALMGRIRDTQDPSPISPGVHVLNAHVGKGQQFDWVIVPGLEEGHVPSVYARSASELLEEQRVLLVMLSRAQSGLFLTHAQQTRNQYGRVFNNPASRWWNSMEAECIPLTAIIRQRLGLPI